MAPYTVGELAELAGVSVRTLHHYDHIGLLTPSERSRAGYRLYHEEDLLRLQQILFYREFDMGLAEIGEVLDEPAFDKVVALRDHRTRLQKRHARISRLIATIDKTITRLLEGTMTVTDEDLYAGFKPEEAERYQREARETFGQEAVEGVEQRIKNLTKDQWTRIREEGEAVAEDLSALTDRPAGDAEVQAVVARHHAWIENFYPAPAEVYRGLASMYTTHPEFRAFYNKHGEGLADFLRQAMEIFAQRELE